MSKTFTVTMTRTLTSEQVSDLLCSAFDGGLSSWCRIAGYLEPTSWIFASDPPASYGHYTNDYPLNPGGAVLIVDEEGDDDGVLTLDEQAIQKGLNILAETYPSHFADILAENADAIAGDAFLQCCLFGKVIYG